MIETVTDSNFINFASNEDGGMDFFVRSLVQTQLIAVMGDELMLTTELCQVAFVGSNIYAGENNAGQFTAWIEAQNGHTVRGV